MLRAELTHALRDVRLDVALAVADGETVALAGASGAGKTTVLRAIAGLVRPDAGRVTCGDAVWLDRGGGVDLAPEARRCGVLFQDYALFGHLRTWQNVAYGLRDVRRSQRRVAAIALLARFGAEGLADARPGALSGGERQRVALARALATRPRVLLLDEPLSALDPATRASSARELAAVLADGGVPAIVVTHDYVEAATLGDRVAVLDGGRIVQRGPAARLSAAPASGFVADFTGAAVLTGRVREQGGGERGLTLVQLDGGGVIAATAPGDGEVAVSIHPWEVTIEPAGAPATSSAQNRLEAEVVSVTEIGNRVRVGLALPQPFTAEVTQASVQRLGLRPGLRVVAVWKAAATRVTPR
jgi:molybdate transport system ATP-binding protein